MLISEKLSFLLLGLLSKIVRMEARKVRNKLRFLHRIVMKMKVHLAKSFVSAVKSRNQSLCVMIVAALEVLSVKTVLRWFIKLAAMLNTK